MSVCFRESTVFESFLFYQWPEKSIKHKANVSLLVKAIDNSVNRRIARQGDLGVSGKVNQPKDLRKPRPLSIISQKLAFQHQINKTTGNSFEKVTAIESILNLIPQMLAIEGFDL